MPSVMWFRRDLRVRDHDALTAAGSHGPVVALFVIDPAFSRAGEARLAALGASLRALSTATGGALVVRRGRPEDVVPAVAAEANAATVFVTRDSGPYGHARDARVAARLRADGRSLRGVGSPYVHEPGTIRKADGAPYAVFTAYFRAWRARPIDTNANRAGSSTVWHPLASEALPDLPASPHVGGEAAAQRRWEQFLDGALAEYGARRNTPSTDGTSRLSAALRWGEIHPRQLIADAAQLVGSAAESFIRQLCWRDFYADVLHHHPDAGWHPLDQRFAVMRVDTDEAAVERFERWKQGLTGFPLVDAGMRQLSATGWMHNRVRMIAASFLVKDLHLPWQWGARHFLDHLIDGDLANNSLGWQWVAGTGTDAAPYHRVLNPSLQLQRFDPNGDYTRQWIPELASGSYPAPMVDHAAERAEALARFAALPRPRRAPAVS